MYVRDMPVDVDIVTEVAVWVCEAEICRPRTV